jgi:hypothetical protein
VIGSGKMASLFRRLDEEETVVRGELEALREKVTAAEERLERLTVTRETAASLLGDSAAAGDSVAVPEGDSRH